MTGGSKQPLVVGNWKMNLGEPEAKALVEALRKNPLPQGVDLVVAPSFPCLRTVLDAVAGSAIAVGAQNMHWEDSGAFTGEVAPPMLAAMGVRFVIIGHSERRALFGESDQMVARKVAAAARHGLTPIVCVGEDERERDAGLMRDVVVPQVNAAFADLSSIPPPGWVVAYEPIWAIGTGRTPSPSDVTAAHEAIRGALKQRFDESASSIRILYGGSVSGANASALLKAPLVDGALVGGASLSAASFAAIAEAARP